MTKRAWEWIVTILVGILIAIREKLKPNGGIQ